MYFLPLVILEDHDQLKFLPLVILEDHDQLKFLPLVILEDHEQLKFLPLVILEDHDQLSCRVQSGNNKGTYVTMQRLCRLHNPAPVCLWCRKSFIVS